MVARPLAALLSSGNGAYSSGVCVTSAWRVLFGGKTGTVPTSKREFALEHPHANRTAR
jgi:hypothetical protein